MSDNNENCCGFNNLSLPDIHQVNSYFSKVTLPAHNTPIPILIVKFIDIFANQRHCGRTSLYSYKRILFKLMTFYEAQNLDNLYRRVEVDELFLKSVENYAEWYAYAKAVMVAFDQIEQFGEFKSCTLYRKYQNKYHIQDIELLSFKKKFLFHLTNLSRKDQTVKWYSSSIDLCLYLGNITNLMQLKAMKFSSIVNTFKGLKELGLSPKTANGYLFCYKKFLDFAFTSNLVPYDFSKISMRFYFLRENIKTFLDVAGQKQLKEALEHTSKRNKAVILLALTSGLRNQDIATLKFSEIDYKEHCIVKNQGKTKSQIIVPLVPEAFNAIQDYVNNERPNDKVGLYNFVFVSAISPYKYVQSYDHMLHDLMTKWDIKPVNPTGKIGMHLLRRTFIYNLMRHNTPAHVITELLGHEYQTSDRFYYSADDEMLRECSLDLSEIGD